MATRRRGIFALAIIFWIISGVTFFAAFLTYPNLVPWTSPQTELVSLSSTVQFMLPPSIPFSSSQPIVVTYTLTGTEIADHTQLTMNVSVSTPYFAQGQWIINAVRVTPDNAIIRLTYTLNETVRTFTRSTGLLLNLVRDEATGDEVWIGDETFELTAFGTFGATVEIYITPTQEMWDLMTKTGDFTPALASGWFRVHNSTDILIDSLRAITAQKTAEQATQKGISLTWFIICLASLDIGFRVNDYSVSEDREHRRRSRLHRTLP